VIVIDATKLTQTDGTGQIAAGSLLASFFAFAPGFKGGVFVAAGDFNGDGLADVTVGAGPGAGPSVIVINGAKLTQVQASGQIADAAVLSGFFAYDGGFPGGVRVDMVDVNGDGLADVITGAGPGAGPHVRVFRATDVAILDSFFATAASFTGGTYV
jgi:hypothetical protein